MTDGYEYSDEREEHLEELADRLGVDLDFVLATADLLGSNEDYDGLVTTLEDLTYFGFYFGF